MPAARLRDDELAAIVAERLFAVMSMFPKRLVRVDELIHTFGMPLSQMQILALVERADLSVRQISERTGVAKPNVTPLVDALRDQGYISRRPHEKDRRMVCVHLEDPGAEALCRIREALAGQVRAWPKGVTRAKVRRAVSGMDALCELMDAMNEPNDT